MILVYYLHFRSNIFIEIILEKLLSRVANITRSIILYREWRAGIVHVYNRDFAIFLFERT